jgi:pantoate--beta-alanine ligase
MKGVSEMITISTVKEARAWCDAQRAGGRTIGLVPTMGYFHEGHLALMRKARAQCGAAAVTLFVNPTQFGPGEDFTRYPRDLERDEALAENAGADVLFCPEVDELYPQGFGTFVDPGPRGDKLCGAYRPGHFRGVATIVLKLFNIFMPDKAFFGRKDAQQLLIIASMTRDLDHPVEVVPVDTVREHDGLAMSSRNVYLKEEERRQAPVLYRALQAGRAVIDSGERESSKIIDKLGGVLAEAPLANVQYVSLTDTERFEPLESAAGKILLAMAVFFGKTRLIDNIMLDLG